MTMAVPTGFVARARWRCPAAVALALAVRLVLSSNADAQAADPNALWEIVHGQCLPDLQLHGDPKPCAMVGLQDGVERGYAILKDLRGRAQFLLIPTARVSGIEDSVLLEPGAPNYFAVAWQARAYVETSVGRVLPRESISLAINSMFARSQNQLHIHIDCIRVDVRDALLERASQIGERWAPFEVPLAGHRYMARRVLGEELGQTDPFKLLADGIPDARREMGRHTLVVSGATFADGGLGFIILDGRADPAVGDWGGGEELQDHACALADRGSADIEPR